MSAVEALMTGLTLALILVAFVLTAELEAQEAAPPDA